MDRKMLIEWKSELEITLSNLEKQISELDNERRQVRAQLGALATLLSIKNGVKIDQDNTITIVTESEAITGFLTILQEKGWSISHAGKRPNIYIANFKGKSVNLWIKFSRYDDISGRYWFGISSENLENMSNVNGGIVLLLNAPNQYLCFTFDKMQEILINATKAKTGKKFHIREQMGKILLLPTGTGEWIDVSRFRGIEGLREVGIED